MFHGLRMMAEQQVDTAAFPKRFCEKHGLLISGATVVLRRKCGHQNCGILNNSGAVPEFIEDLEGRDCRCEF